MRRTMESSYNRYHDSKDPDAINIKSYLITSTDRKQN